MAASTNRIVRQKFSAWSILLNQFKNPLLLIFIISTVVSYALGQKIEAIAIWLIMSFSIILGFVNEYQAGRIVESLMKKISLTATILKDGKKMTVPVSDIKIGDTVFLYPGSIIPADIKLISASHLEINESVLTGESLPVEKAKEDDVFMGTTVTGGTAEGKVFAVGAATKFGAISAAVAKARPETEFQKGLRQFSSFLAKVAGVTVLAIIVFNFFLGRPMTETILFALTIAMGITPELLPLIVTLSLSYGARKMAKKSVVVKQFVSIEDLGNMDIICTDKTGTLTEGKIFLDSYLDGDGEASKKVLEFGLVCNSIFVHRQVFGDSIDRAIWEKGIKEGVSVEGKYKKLFQIPFDFENRLMIIVVEVEGKKLLICKGSPDAVIAKSKITDVKKIEDLISKVQDKGFRTVAVSSREIKNFDPKKIKEEITNLNFEGILTFTDIPKKDLAQTFEKFKKLKVEVKIITGDSERVAQKVAGDAGFVFRKILTGPEIEKMSDSDLEKNVRDADIFARVTPSQKNRIILSLKKGDHGVGYLGDGVNDAPALNSADVGISVNTGVDVAKDAASVVLLKKGLTEIADGITEGRIIFNNTIKYILMGTSSDFGNMVSAAAASIFLPFLPMAPVQVLLTDILYDISQLSISSDNVDPDQITRPKKWDLNYIKKFMWVFGPISTVYDFLTFAIMFFIFKARGSFFQTGWFIESLITEILVVFVIRTRKIPFFRSTPGTMLLTTCFLVILTGLYLPFSIFARYLDFTPLPALYFVFLIAISITYLIFVEIGKFFLNKERFE